MIGSKWSSRDCVPRHVSLINRVVSTRTFVGLEARGFYVDIRRYRGRYELHVYIVCTVYVVTC